MLQGWGGWPVRQVTDVSEFGLGRLKSPNTPFMVLNEAAISDGLLGADFLYYFDLDFDFAKAKLNLISPDHCKGKVVYWSKGDYGVVPFEYDTQRKIALSVVLDGKKLNAVLDTGASVTVMSLETAASLFDWDEDDIVKGRQKPVFASMAFGSVVISHPAITLVSDKESVLLGSRQPKMIIGMDVLRRLHLYISYKEKMIYVTPATQY
jgi:predicted aspartyl protease